MAQLSVNCIHSPSPSIRMKFDHSENRVHQHVKLYLNNKQAEKSSSRFYAMNGGEGPNSYAKNSSYQRGILEVAKPIIEEEIATKLDINPHQKHFRIADFGCSTGLNSFPSMEIIIESVEKKFQAQGLNSKTPDFHVLFNDQVTNDFNTLFRSLPSKRNYYASGLPGPFHGRLLPKASIEFAYSSYALHWLSSVPEQVVNCMSPSWNEGKVHYTDAKQEVFQAYSNQYANDIEAFLESRAAELVTGGLMALLVPADPTFDISDTSFTIGTQMNLLGSCLIDMANKGILKKENVDSFNFPLYFTIPQELKAIIERNHYFSIERMEVLTNPGRRTLTSASSRSAFLRVLFEELLTDHFGREIMDELFKRYKAKLADSPTLLNPENEKSIIIFVLLKRKTK